MHWVLLHYNLLQGKVKLSNKLGAKNDSFEKTWLCFMEQKK